MKIHSLVVMSKNGVPIYHRNFSEQFEKTDFTMLTSFLSAILQFSNAVVKQNLSVLEMGELRFFIRNSDDGEFLFILIADNLTSVLLINERIQRIIYSFFQTMSSKECQDSVSYICSSIIDSSLDTIVQIKDDHSDVAMEGIKKIFEKERSNGEFRAGALLSMKGEIYYSSLPLEDLDTALKEIETRTKSNAKLLSGNPKFIWQAEEKMIFSQSVSIKKFEAPVYCVLLFDATTTLGMADFALEDIVKKITDSE